MEDRSPGAGEIIDGPPLEDQLEVFWYANHLGLRVGGRRYQMTRRGPRSTNFARWLSARLRSHPEPIQALTLQASPAQLAEVVGYFEALRESGSEYQHLYRNCAQVTCSALRSAGLPAPPRLLAWLPPLAFFWLRWRAGARARRTYAP